MKFRRSLNLQSAMPASFARVLLHCVKQQAHSDVLGNRLQLAMCPCTHTLLRQCLQVAWTLDHLADKATGLSYEDLHGVPCLLLLCERGRMGDTFPQTFDCLDMRLRCVHPCTNFLVAPWQMIVIIGCVKSLLNH